MSLSNPNLARLYQKRDANAEKPPPPDQPSDNEDKSEVRAGEPQIKLSRDGRAATTRIRRRHVTEGAEEGSQGEIIQELRWVKTDGGWKIISQRDLRVIR